MALLTVWWVCRRACIDLAVYRALSSASEGHQGCAALPCLWTACARPAGYTLQWALHVPCLCSACRLHNHYGPSICPD